VAEHNGARPGTTRNLYSPTGVVVELDKLLAGQVTPPIRLESGDTIYVPEMPYFYIEGEVGKPGQYPLEQGITIHQAITKAGGFSKFARRTHLWVKRLVDGKPTAFRARLDDFLQASDILVVPESIF
jgi:polysaccharide export outer membrane protein